MSAPPRAASSDPLGFVRRRLPSPSPSGQVQAKLEVSDPGDALEIEADQVMRMTGASAAVPPLAGRPGERVDRACAACTADDELQRTESGTAGEAETPGFGRALGRPSPDASRGAPAASTARTEVEADGAGPGERVQRQSGSSGDRTNDPNFLLCLALCELGVPPSLWRTVVNEILRAVSREYRDRLGEMRGSQEFESWRAAFTIMSTFNKLKAILGFLGESRIGPLVIEHPAAQAIRRAVLARLAERGLESAALEVASQIIRKVAIAIEVAIAAGCTTYCGATAIANALLDFTSAAINAIAGFVDTLSAIGAGLAQAITRPILVARASMDPTNWNLSALPERSRAHMGAIGFAFRLTFTPDSFLASMARPLSSYNIQPILGELAQDISTALQARGGFAQLVTFTPDFLRGLTPLQLVDILKDYRLLSFVQDPEVLVDQQQAQQAATPP